MARRPLIPCVFDAFEPVSSSWRLLGSSLCLQLPSPEVVTGAGFDHYEGSPMLALSFLHIWLWENAHVFFVPWNSAGADQPTQHTLSAQPSVRPVSICSLGLSGMSSACLLTTWGRSGDTHSALWIVPWMLLSRLEMRGKLLTPNP